MKNTVTRRNFIKTASAAAVFTIVKPESVFGYPANSRVQLGVIGCGGRGTHVGTSFMNNTETAVVAIADLFADQLNKGKAHFNELCSEKNIPVIKDSNIFLGSRAYLELLESKDVDAVQISTPDFLHPLHLNAVVDAGKHVYCEKPAAPDVHGCREVMWAGRKAADRQTLMIGFQIRRATPYVELISRIHRGDIGQIVTVQAYYFAGAIHLPEFPGVSPDELRMRHWYYDRVLSGDIIIDQGIHIIDVCNWALDAHPIKATGTGGGEGKTHDGTCWSHFQVNYEYPNSIHVCFQSTQFDPGYGDVANKFFGTKGTAEAHYVGGVFIKGDNEWDSGVARAGQEVSAADWARGSFRSSLDDADPMKEKAFIESIRSGNYANEAQQGATSTLSAILGRTAAYNGEDVTWDEMLASDERWDPMMDLTKFDKG